MVEAEKLSCSVSCKEDITQLLPGGHPRYSIRSSVGAGSFGNVCTALDTHTGELVALKFMKRGPQITNYAAHEICNQMRLRYPHIICLREVFLTDAYLVIVMEYAAGGDLFRHVLARKRLPEEEARWLFQQMVMAVDFCHRMASTAHCGVVNRDIKLENTLLDGSARPLVKLADFGFSKDVNVQSAPNTKLGTPDYLAPEVMYSKPWQSYDGSKADIWALGVCLYIMCTGDYPFRRGCDMPLDAGLRHTALVQRIRTADYSFPPGLRLSDGLKQLLAKILVADAGSRASFQDIMNSPWFLEGLDPAIFKFNDEMVAQCSALASAQEKHDAIAELVAEAATPPPGIQVAQRGGSTANYLASMLSDEDYGSEAGT